MRRPVLLAVTGAATVGFGTPAVADAPPGLFNHFSQDEFVCDDEAAMIIAPNGRSGYIDGTLHLATTFTFAGTFTPTDGEPEMFSGEKTWPSLRGHEVTCTLQIEETSPDGTFTGSFRVTAVPVR
ncbi:MAG: hypothetical protein H0W46_08785 [Acidimicrobiia bacterium]|nr:hypothetical protein [Acidimicrobiia bacterium]